MFIFCNWKLSTNILWKFILVPVLQKCLEVSFQPFNVSKKLCWEYSFLSFFWVFPEPYQWLLSYEVSVGAVVLSVRALHWLFLTIRSSAKSGWDLATEEHAHGTGLTISVCEVGAAEDLSEGRRVQLEDSSPLWMTLVLNRFYELCSTLQLCLSSGKYVNTQRKSEFAVLRLAKGYR